MERAGFDEAATGLCHRGEAAVKEGGIEGRSGGERFLCCFKNRSRGFVDDGNGRVLKVVSLYPDGKAVMANREGESDAD